jgi:hypothetical protein
MAVMVDQHPLSTESLGLNTVGQVLSHLQKDNRLIVHILIDGQEPDLNRIASICNKPLVGHTLFIETAEPKRLALEVLGEVEKQLDEADRLKNDAVQSLQSNQQTKAMEKLAGCFSTWQHAQESIQKTAQLLRVDLSLVIVTGKPLATLLQDFSEQLRKIKAALENRDFVTLGDILAYETTETSAQWREAIGSMRAIIQ